MKEKFEDRPIDGESIVTLEPGRVWNVDKLMLCKAIVSIVEDYGRKGFSLSLRQVYYQLVSKDLIPNHDKVYQEARDHKKHNHHQQKLELPFCGLPKHT